jgi:DNA-directed RNA polymerase specialized sigma24 family protein
MVHGVGYPQLARELGKSVSAVKKTASRAMLRLRASPHLRAVVSDLRTR